MLRWPSLLLIIFCRLLIDEGYSYIVIWKNVKLNNGLKITTVASDQVMVGVGMNVSLICNDKNKTFNNKVYWSRKRDRLKPSNSSFFKSADDNKKVNILNFTNVTTDHQGKYICTSLNNEISREISLMVIYPKDVLMLLKNLNKIDNGNRVKRDSHNLTGLSDEFQSILHLLKENYHVPWLDSDNKKPSETESNRKRYGDYLPSRDKPIYYKPNWDADFNSNNGNDGSFEYNNEANKESDNHSNYTPFKKRLLLNILYLILGGFGAFVLIYIVAKCCNKNKANARNRRSNNRRVLHPIHTNYHFASRAIPTSTIDNRGFNNVPVTIIIDHPVSDQEIMELLDLPPTYEHSTANSAISSKSELDNPNNETGTQRSDNNVCALPPTYEEALANEYCSSNNDVENNVSCDTNRGDTCGGGGGDCDD